MNKTLHELERAVEPFGYAYVGLDGADHHTFLNAETGGVIKAANSSHVDITLQVKRLKASAKRNLNAQKSMSAEWVSWLRERFEIRADEQKEVELVLNEEWTRFLKERHGGVRRGSRQLPYMALKASPFAEQITRGRGGGIAGKTSSPSVWVLSGPLFGVHTDTEEKMDDDRVPDAVGVVAGDEPRVLAAVPDEPEADGRDGGSEPGEPLAEPSAPRIDPQPLTIPGVSIPADLATALQDALSGDLRAENELLKDALTHAHGALSAALSVLEQGLDLSGENGTVPPAESRIYHTALRHEEGKPYTPREGAVRDREAFGGLGRTRLFDLEALRTAHDAGTLPDPFHTSMAEQAINEYNHEHGLPPRSQGAVSGSLHAFDIHGHVQRIQRGWFRWGK